MTVKNYNNLIDEMKELADKINKHYDTVTFETVEELDTPDTETQRILNELKDKGVLTEDESIEEGWQNVSPIDKERYTEIPDLEGPFMTMSGKVVYYDPKEGKYYDRDSDMYLDYDEWKKYDSKPDWGKDEDVSEATMQRQHFEVIADIIGSFPSTMKIRKDFMTHAMDKLREINPQFKDSTFVARVRKAMQADAQTEPSDDELGKRTDHDETPSAEEYR